MAQMTKIKLNEISLVDYPAHLVNGFAVIKSADKDSGALWDALGNKKEIMPEKTLADVLKDVSADDIRAALSEDVLKALTPEVAPVENADILKGLAPELVAEFAKRDEEIAKATARADAFEKAAQVEKAARLDEAAVVKSTETFKNLAFDHKVVAPALRKFAEADSDAAAAIETMLKAVEGQAESGAIFKELGSTASQPSNAEAAIEAKANEIAKERKISKSEAWAAAYDENPELVKAHLTGGSN